LTKSSAASIRQRLFNLARARGENFDYVLKTYLIQRLLYRLGLSPHRNRFLLKGAMLFWVWGGDAHRPTRDIDLLGYGDGDIETLVADFRDICSVVAEDGLEFDLASIRGIEIKEDALYQGVRITGQASLDSARITFQVDIGFGDAVSPGAKVATVPSFLDLPEPELNVYPVYTVIAEKFQAMVMLGIANSRIKDFYDLWVIASRMEVEGDLLVEAIKATFERRETALPEYRPSIFESPFTSDENKQRQWLAFLRKNGLDSEMSFEVLMGELQGFLLPVYLAAAQGGQFDADWLAGHWE
jgi:predicted nucleotidyltransferase component of viral defense system